MKLANMAIAAAQGLRLWSDGFMVDDCADGLACYCKEPDDSDSSRESVILATFAGFKAQEMFCLQYSLPFLDDSQVRYSLDWCDARSVMDKFSREYIRDDDLGILIDRLETRSKELVGKHWLAIKAMAAALLKKGWEPVKALSTGTEWSRAATAKYVTAEESASVLQLFGIAAVVARYTKRT